MTLTFTQQPSSFIDQDASATFIGQRPSQDVKALLDDLQHAFDAKPDITTVAEEKEAGGEAPPNRRWLKIVVGCAVVGVFGILPLRAFWQTSSVEAVVNAPLVTLRSPIDGKIESLFRPNGSEAGADDAGVLLNSRLAEIVNPRGDKSRLNDLQYRLIQIKIERSNLADKLAATQTAQADLARQAEVFRVGRIAELQSQLREIEASIAAADSTRQDATDSASRAAVLVGSGAVSTVTLAHLTKDQVVAEQTQAGLRHKYDTTKVELDAANNGMFIGDSYNDRPSSAQRSDDLKLRIKELIADIALDDQKIAALSNETAIEAHSLDERTHASIVAPTPGRLWEAVARQGEDVVAGQPLLKILDCSGAVITANVTERVYNGLQIGQAARFEPNDGQTPLEGRITNLTGRADARGNWAINPDALSKEPYRVTVSLPVNHSGNGCSVGRTGRVVFQDAVTKR